MSTKLTHLETLRRTEVEQEQVRIIRQMKDDLDTFPNCFLDQASLESLGVILGSPLDVDETMDFSSTRFFQPWVPDGVLQEASNESGAIWMDKYRPKYRGSEWVFGILKSHWFVQCFEALHELEPELWEPWNTDPQMIREGTGLDLPFHNFAHHWPYINREYQSVCAYFPVNTSRPHVACLVADSMEASTTGGQALRSDVDYAIAMVLWQLSEGQHTNHHTKPALIYTLERDQHARITQAHFDSKRQKLVLRQSRHLDLSGPEPTPDAFLLLRWIACRPAGETEYPEEGGDGGGEEGDGDRDGGDGDGDGDGGEGDPPGVAPRLVVVGCA